MSKVFRPWLKPSLIAAGMGVAGCAALALGAMLARRSATPDIASLVSLASGAVLLLAAIPVAQRAWARFYGQWVESRARQAVRRKLARGWTTHEFVMGQRGDIDLVLDSPDKSERYVIEIKSQEDVRVQRALGIFGDPKLRTRQAPKGLDPLEQARLNAQTLQGSAVLWYPRSRRTEIHQLKGVLVVLGPAATLLKTLNAKRGWFA